MILGDFKFYFGEFSQLESSTSLIINKPKAIMKGKTNHKFPKLKTSNDSIPKKYEVRTTNQPIKK